MSEDIQQTQEIKQDPEIGQFICAANTSQEQKTRRSFTERYVWKSCCFKVDKRVLSWAVQVTISMIVLLFAIFNLTIGDGGCFDEGLIMLVIGFYLPSPKLKD